MEHSPGENLTNLAISAEEMIEGYNSGAHHASNGSKHMNSGNIMPSPFQQKLSSAHIELERWFPAGSSKGRDI